MTTTPPNSWGFSLFCDDIRAEVGGKISVMGVYQADMIFLSNLVFPIVIPKFCILIKYYSMDAFRDEIAMRVFLPGDAKDAPSFVATLPLPQIVNASYPLEDDQERIFNLTFPFIIAPFHIKQEGFIKVRALCGGVTTKLGSLMVRIARPDEQISGLVAQPPTLQPAT